MPDEEKEIVLSGDKAVKLWQEGKDGWNKWVEQNPVAVIDFSKVDFTKFRKNKKIVISFSEFNFPTGHVSFKGTIFGDGDVDFNETNFGDGGLDFFKANFGFGGVHFRNTTFGDGYVSFNSTDFGDGYVDFNNASFDTESVTFIDTIFGDGYVDFSDVSFGNGIVSFASATFGEGFVSFDETNFGDGVVTFDEAKFIGSLNLEYCKNTEKIESLDFRSCTFKGAVTIKNIKLNCVLDMVNTSLTNQISLHGVTCSLQRKRNKWGVKIVKDKDDRERLTRLKELAETNKNHEQALAFHADEQRSKRWVERRKLASILDMIFSGASNYGQSILRPFTLLVLSIIIFTVPYTFLSDSYRPTINFNSEILIFSAANSIPFLTSARGARENGVKQFFEKQKGTLSWIYATMMLQGVVSVILLFLIGLGLRNRFRI